MKAIRFDGSLRLQRDAELPWRKGEALIKVICAGICNTDLEITKGYAGFHGTLGHEFVGRVVESPDAELIGRRVAGEINVGCDECELCRAGDARHCAARTVLGIKGRDGAMAEFVSLPARNLIEVPDSIDDLSAVLIEPLAAACHILDQVKIDSSMRVAVIGDGKLAQMIVIALAATQCQLTVIGRHREKLDLAQKSGAQRAVVAGQEAVAEKSFDVVVEASGSPSGLADALRLARPLGAVVLKSTHHQTAELAMSQMVVDEVSITGSRCGRFLPAIEMLNNCALDLRPLISHHYSIDDGLSAFEKSAERTSLKVLLHID